MELVVDIVDAVMVELIVEVSIVELAKEVVVDNWATGEPIEDVVEASVKTPVEVFVGEEVIKLSVEEVLVGVLGGMVVELVGRGSKSQ